MVTSFTKWGITFACVWLAALALYGCGGSPSGSSNANGDADGGAPDMAATLSYLKASYPTPGAFGHSIALSADGSTLAIGAPAEASKSTGIDGDANDRSLDTAGAVYVFLRNGNTWVQQAYVKASNTDAFDQFGSSVALSADGNTLAVGAVGEASNATGINGNEDDDSFGSAGAVYVFHRSAGAWTQQAYVKASHVDGGDHFGTSVALSGDGNRLAVGASREDGTALNPGANNGDDSGAVYVFARDILTSAWSEKAYVKASNAGLGDRFGSTVALSSDGKTMAVGAIWEQSNGTGPGNDDLFQAGAAYVFTRDATETWTEKAYLKASNVAEPHQFGHSLALSGDGNTLAVGAPYADSSNSTPGASPSDRAGAAYVFTRNPGDTWTQKAFVKASNAETFDEFGSSLALSHDGGLLVVGAHGESSNARGLNGDQSDNSATESGAVYAFSRSGGDVWSALAYLKASNADAFDWFGMSVALTSDGRTLAVGAPTERSNATGVNGNQDDNSRSRAGAVYVLSITTP